MIMTDRLSYEIGQHGYYSEFCIYIHIQYYPVHTSKYVTCQARSFQKLLPCSTPLQSLFYQKLRKILLTSLQEVSSSQG